MAKFRNKPIVIEAEQYVKYGKLVKGMCNSRSCYSDGNTQPHVHTIHNNQLVNLEIGDYIIPEPDGIHYYPCKPDIFKATYEIVDEDNKIDMGEVSDGWHTFNELYEYRMLYNAALFNEMAKGRNFNEVHKSLRHNDGELCFGGGWFVVVALLPTGQITNHYKIEDWELFNIPECDKAKFIFDGHTPADVSKRLRQFILSRD